MVSNNDLTLLHSNQRLFVEELLKRKIDIELIDIDRELIRCEYKGHIEWILDRDSSIMPYSLSIVCGDKFLTKTILEKNEISVPKGQKFALKDKIAAVLYAEKIGFPVVAKPVFGSHGDFVFTDINTAEELVKLLQKNYDKDFIIEKQFIGKEYRVFVTRNGDYAVLLRDAAHVSGNGKDTIAKLIEIENEKRKERINALCPIVIDEMVEKFLRLQGLTLKSVLKPNNKIYLRNNSNLAKGGVCEDFTDKIDKSVIEICKKILKIFGNIPYLGIDFMSNNITKKQDSNSYSIVEVNTVPGIHMHMRPAIGKPRNVAKMMADLIFPETKREK